MPSSLIATSAEASRNQARAVIGKRWMPSRAILICGPKRGAASSILSLLMVRAGSNVSAIARTEPTRRGRLRVGCAPAGGSGGGHARLTVYEDRQPPARRAASKESGSPTASLQTCCVRRRRAVAYGRAYLLPDSGNDLGGRDDGGWRVGRDRHRRPGRHAQRRGLPGRGHAVPERHGTTPWPRTPAKDAPVALRAAGKARSSTGAAALHPGGADWGRAIGSLQSASCAGAALRPLAAPVP